MSGVPPKAAERVRLLASAGDDLALQAVACWRRYTEAKRLGRGTRHQRRAWERATRAALKPRP